MAREDFGEQQSLFSDQYVHWTAISQGQFGNDMVERKILVDAIDEDTIRDPRLRSALKLAAAARKLGWIPNPDGSRGFHYVLVESTDEGRDSKWLRQTQTDGLLKALYRAGVSS